MKIIVLEDEQDKPNTLAEVLLCIRSMKERPEKVYLVTDKLYDKQFQESAGLSKILFKMPLSKLIYLLKRG